MNDYSGVAGSGEVRFSRNKMARAPSTSEAHFPHMLVATSNDAKQNLMVRKVGNGAR